MKNYLLVLVSIFTLGSTAVLNAQEDKSAIATFTGFDGESYSFTTIAKENETPKTIDFSEVSAEILEEIDLKSETSKGKDFSITYTVTTETKVNAVGEEETIEVYTLKSIKEAAY